MLIKLANFVFPLLAGYLFLILCDFFSYRIQKESGYHVLFKSPIVGFLLFIFSGLVLSSILMFAFAGVFALAINQYHNKEISYGRYIEKREPPYNEGYTMGYG